MDARARIEISAASAICLQEAVETNLTQRPSSPMVELAQARLDRINAGEATWPSALDDFDTLSAPLANPPPPPAF